MTLKIGNTLTDRVDNFKPLVNRHIKMFVCGPTVYDHIHIGHARTYTAYDIIARYLTAGGFKVSFIVNITDVDDKIYAKAKEEKLHYRRLAEKHTKEFLKDLTSLNISSITSFPKASEYIDEAITQVHGLIKRGYAYAVDGNVYYDTAKFQEYGALSHQSEKDLKLRRIEPDPRKKSQADFLLWRRCGDEEPVWNSPWGKGRPGWHIEDTSISIKNFGNRYDLHGGAIDLIYPHHEAEIAQAEALTGEKPFVQRWIHTGTLNLKGKKMSKSLGNHITVKDALRKYDVDTLRLFFASHHYREEVDFKEPALRHWSKKVARLKAALSKLDHQLQRTKHTPSMPGDSALLDKIDSLHQLFCKAMEDDFNTSRAVTIIFRFVDLAEKKMGSRVSRQVLLKAHKLLWKMVSIVGLFESQITEQILEIPCTH